MDVVDSNSRVFRSPQLPRVSRVSKVEVEVVESPWYLVTAENSGTQFTQGTDDPKGSGDTCTLTRKNRGRRRQYLRYVWTEFCRLESPVYGSK